MSQTHEKLMRSMSGAQTGEKLGAPSLSGFEMPQMNHRRGTGAVLAVLAVSTFGRSYVQEAAQDAGNLVSDIAGYVDNATMAKAEAAVLDSDIEADVACVAPGMARTTFRLAGFTQDQISNTRLGVSTSSDLPFEQQTPLSDLLSPTRTGVDGVATPPNTGQATYEGTFGLTTSVNVNDRVTAWFSKGIPETPGSSGGSVTFSAMDCSGGTPPAGGGQPPKPPVVIPVLPICKFESGITTFKTTRVSANGRVGLKVVASVDPSSTAFVVGHGKGSKAARVDIGIGSNVGIVGKLPRNMTATQNGNTLKKGQSANTISIDIPETGLTKQKSLIASLKLVLKGKRATLTAAPKFPANTIKFENSACPPITSFTAKKATATLLGLKSQ